MDTPVDIPVVLYSRPPEFTYLPENPSFFCDKKLKVPHFLQTGLRKRFGCYIMYYKEVIL